MHLNGKSIVRKCRLITPNDGQTKYEKATATKMMCWHSKSKRKRKKIQDDTIYNGCEWFIPRVYVAFLPLIWSNDLSIETWRRNWIVRCYKRFHCWRIHSLCSYKVKCQLCAGEWINQPTHIRERARTHIIPCDAGWWMTASVIFESYTHNSIFTRMKIHVKQRRCDDAHSTYI